MRTARAGLPVCGLVPWTVAGCWFRSLNQVREDRLQVRVVLVAGWIGGTATEERIKRPLGCSREAGVDVDLWRGGRVEHDAANIRGKEAHHGQGQSGAVGDAVQVDLVVAQGAHQVMHIPGVLDRGVVAEVDALPHQAVVACKEGLVGLAAERGLRVAHARAGPAG